MIRTGRMDIAAIVGQQKLPSFHSMGLGEPVQSGEPEVFFSPRLNRLVVLVRNSRLLGKLLLGQPPRCAQGPQPLKQAFDRFPFHLTERIAAIFPLYTSLTVV